MEMPIAVDEEETRARTRTYAVRLLYDGTDADSVQDLGQHKLLRLSGTAKDLGDPTLQGHIALVAKEEDGHSSPKKSEDDDNGTTSVSHLFNESKYKCGDISLVHCLPWMVPIKEIMGGVKNLQSFQDAVGVLIEEAFALAWYASFEAAEAGLLAGVKTISNMRKHKEVVEKLQGPMKTWMENFGFIHMTNISKGWPTFVNMPVFLEVITAGLIQYPSASNLADFFIECMQSGGACLLDVLEGSNASPSQKADVNSLMGLQQSDALDCALQWRALSRLRKPRTAIGHAFLKECTNEKVQTKILKSIEASKALDFTKEFRGAAKVCEAVATAIKANNVSALTSLQLDFGPGF